MDTEPDRDEHAHRHGDVDGDPYLDAYIHRDLYTLYSANLVFDSYGIYGDGIAIVHVHQNGDLAHNTERPGVHFNADDYSYVAILGDLHAHTIRKRSSANG